MTIKQLISDRYHRRHTRGGGYPVAEMTFYDFINQHSIFCGSLFRPGGVSYECSKVRDAQDYAESLLANLEPANAWNDSKASGADRDLTPTISLHVHS